MPIMGWVLENLAAKNGVDMASVQDRICGRDIMKIVKQK